MDEVFEKAVQKLNEFFTTVDTGRFVDDEHMSLVIEGCTMLLQRKVKVSDAPAAVAVLNYPEETVELYEEFVSYVNKPTAARIVAEDSGLRNAIAELLRVTAKASDDFIVTKK